MLVPSKRVRQSVRGVRDSMSVRMPYVRMPHVPIYYHNPAHTATRVFSTRTVALGHVGEQYAVVQWRLARETTDIREVLD